MSLEFELKVKCDFCKKDITEGESVCAVLHPARAAEQQRDLKDAVEAQRC